MGTATLMAWGLLTCPLVPTTTGAGGGAVGYAGDDEIVGADENGAFDFAEAHAGAAEFGRAQAFADDANFAAGQGKGGGNRVDMRFAVDVLFPEQAIRNAHDCFFGGSRAHLY